MNNVLREIGQQLDIRAVAEYLGLPVDRARNISCPFHHERTPSCHLYEHTFFCFGCHQWGDSVDLVAAVRGVSKYEAAAELNERFSLSADLKGQKGKVKTKPRNLQDSKIEQAQALVDAIAETARNARRLRFPETSIEWLDMIHDSLLSDSELLRRDPVRFMEEHKKEFARYAEVRDKYSRINDAISENGDYPSSKIWAIMGRCGPVPVCSAGKTGR